MGTNELLDGYHRWKACIKLGFEIPDEMIKLHSFKKENDRLSFILSQNLVRRQLTRKQRAELFSKLRKEKRWSLRLIAENTGVSHNTVRNELKLLRYHPDELLTDLKIKSGVQNLTPDKIKGKDGKNYSAIKSLPDYGLKLIAFQNSEKKLRAAVRELERWQLAISEIPLDRDLWKLIAKITRLLVPFNDYYQKNEDVVDVAPVHLQREKTDAPLQIEGGC